MSRYRDRAEAGARLAEVLVARGYPAPAVLGLVRGGVPVAAPIARALGVALDVMVVRKLGVPWAPEVAFGALGPGGVRVLNPETAGRIDPEDIARVSDTEAVVLARREQVYRRGKPPPSLRGHTAILVDDGLATGATAHAAVLIARDLGAERVVFAAPVGAPDAVDRIREEAEVVCPLVPAEFVAVSRAYQEFPQVTDGEVLDLLAAR